MPFDASYRKGKILFDIGRFAEAAAHLEEAALGGHAEAQNDYAFLFKVGRGVSRDLELAGEWYRKAAERGHGDARHNLAILLVEHGGERGIPEAVSWLKVNAGAGHALSQLQLGHWYKHGVGVEPDLTEALRLFGASASQGQPDALALISISERYGASDHKGPFPTFPDCEARALGGDAASMRLLGAYFMLGYGCTADGEAARGWIERAYQAGDIPAARASGLFLFDEDPAGAVRRWEVASEAGDPYGMYLLASSLLDGEGIPVDLERAIALLEAAAEAGFVDAMVVLADHLRVADVIPRDMERSVRWYKRAAQCGHTESQFTLGMLLAAGQGVPADLAMGLHWIESAASRGWDAAQCHLGIRYLQGDGVEVDPKLGVPWLRAAAEQGHAHAQYSLGICYMNGQGVPIDRDFGVHCWRRAAAAGHTTAIASLERLGER